MMKPKLRKNKLKIGDFVRLKYSKVEREMTHLCDSYIVPGSREFRKEDLPEIHFWIGCYLNGIEPLGTVVGFGTEEDDDNPIRVVGVRISHPSLDIFHYYYEGTELKKVKSVPTKKRKTDKRGPKVLRVTRK